MNHGFIPALRTGEHIKVAFNTLWHSLKNQDGGLYHMVLIQSAGAGEGPSASMKCRLSYTYSADIAIIDVQLNSETSLLYKPEVAG